MQKPQMQTNEEYELGADNEASTTVWEPWERLEIINDDSSKSKIRPDDSSSSQPQVASEKAPEKDIKSNRRTRTPAPKEGPQPPVRVLVRSLTHLVQGGHQGVDLMLDSICQYHWKCDFNIDHFRGYWHGRFAFNSKRCFFLVDYGNRMRVGVEIPVLYYEWTGDAFVHAPEMAQDPTIRECLTSKLPFFPIFNTGPRSQERPMRKVIKSRLYNGETVAESHLEHLVDHPDDVEWLEKHLRPRLWAELKRAYEHKKYGFTVFDEMSRPIDRETGELLAHPT